MRRLLWPLGLAAASLSPASAWAQTSLTLELALEQASSRSPTIAAASKEVEATEGAVRQAGAWRNPELNATVEDTRSATRTTTATLDIPLELGGKRSSRVNAAERARDVAVAELAGARAELKSRVLAAYFGVVVAQERSRLASASADLASRGAQAVARRVAAGKVSPVEETRSRIDLANAQLEAVEAAAGLQTAKSTLAVVIGDSQPLFDTVARDMDTVPTRPSFQDLLALLESSPSLAAARAEVERRRSLVDVERARARPDVTLSVGARRDDERGRTQAVVGFSVPLPLFDRNQAAVLEASRRADKASDELQASRLQLIGQLQEASNRLTVAGQSLKTLQQVVLPSAEGAYEAASKGFEAGKFGYLEVLDAQRSVLQARTRYLDTLAAAYQAAALIDRIVGR